MIDYAQIHIFYACGHYKGRLLLILILHNVMHDITSTLSVDVVPSARFTQNGRPMSIRLNGYASSDHCCTETVPP